MNATIPLGQNSMGWQFLPNSSNTVPLPTISADWELANEHPLADEHPLDKIERELDEAIEEAHKQLHRLED